MRPVQDIINKIKWDEKLQEEDFEIEYLDFNNLVSMPYTSIKKIEGLFMLVEKDGKEINIPLHRIRKVKEKGKVIWQRSSAD